MWGSFFVWLLLRRRRKEAKKAPADTKSKAVTSSKQDKGAFNALIKVGTSY